MGVRVVAAGDGRELYVFTYNQGMRGKDLLDELKELGLSGHVQINGERMTRSFPLCDGAVCVFVEERPQDSTWFLRHNTLPSSASTLSNSNPLMKTHLGTDDPIYDLSRTSASAAPLVLAAPPFADYVQGLKSHVLDALDWNFVGRTVQEMSPFLDTEDTRKLSFYRILQGYLLAKFPATVIQVTPSTPGPNADIKIEVLIRGAWILVCLVEVKPEVGLNGEPCVQVMNAYAKATIRSRSRYQWQFFCSCFPVLIVELAGPNIRVGGACHFDKPAHEPFTPFLHMLKFLRDDRHLGILSKALASISLAIGSLVRFYDRVGTAAAAQGAAARTRDASVNWPHHAALQKSSGATVVQLERRFSASQLALMQVGRAQQLVFHIKRPGGAQRVVKFCQRYGKEVHRLWHEAGYAPSFQHQLLQDGDWMVIDMECLAEGDGWRPLHALDPRLAVIGDADANMYRLNASEWDACKRAVRLALRNVQQMHSTTVHGDMRRQNILWNVDGRVAFVDFDWAGISGRDCYPLFINPVNVWPPGVTGAAVMLSQHDVQLLDLELGP
ncbi:hypothetical protein SELMODRAFT_443632 [Selaginella moellendorffii]|uniref:Aminoglycoside phosphotransferase domain-containing protein n=1 Tax=Selaginella moellendorffii TaxID=88036 RepID=D8S337_SELML|nr:uncharacterized protein LOC9657201 [Selaginella moellendorffii]XP_024538461.1 uncharacterized protein LOC9657201 [Selaginella moellendorffii]EFJ21039.1 hypothetical protein SELMODRAFT_443632 [Selaginella moellendorffii]|eukprot:XP_002977701.1 uncharacterized protein LOC9657201 [Selaginella moellendorffii]